MLFIIRFKPLCRVRGSGRCRSGSVAPVASSYIKLHGQESHLAAGGDVKLGDALMHVGVSKNGGTPKSSILIGFSIINHPFWGTPIFGNTHVFVLIGCVFLLLDTR